jgi:hypothetical protein
MTGESHRRSVRRANGLVQTPFVLIDSFRVATALRGCVLERGLDFFFVEAVDFGAGR